MHTNSIVIGWGPVVPWGAFELGMGVDALLGIWCCRVEGLGRLTMTVATFPPAAHTRMHSIMCPILHNALHPQIEVSQSPPM